MQSIAFRAFLLSLLLCASAPFATAGPLPVDVTLYQDYTEQNNTLTFAAPELSFQASDVQFGTDNNWQWYPVGKVDSNGNYIHFGADITGSLYAPTSGTYYISMTADDGAYLYVDGNLALNDGQPHPPQTVDSPLVYLFAGQNPFDLRFYEDFGGDSGVDLNLPQNVSYVAQTPEPASLALLGAGILGLIGMKRRVS